jgi:hypothetical protein
MFCKLLCNLNYYSVQAIHIFFTLLHESSLFSNFWIVLGITEDEAAVASRVLRKKADILSNGSEDRSASQPDKTFSGRDRDGSPCFSKVFISVYESVLVTSILH